MLPGERRPYTKEYIASRAIVQLMYGLYASYLLGFSLYLKDFVRRFLSLIASTAIYDGHLYAYYRHGAGRKRDKDVYFIPAILSLLFVPYNVRFSTSPIAAELYKGALFYPVYYIPSNKTLVIEASSSGGEIAFYSSIASVKVYHGSLIAYDAYHVRFSGEDARIYVQFGCPRKLHVFYPMYGDSDGDGIEDKKELLLGSNPFSSDTDGDDIPDGIEAMISNPRDADTDHDGIVDYLEIYLGLSIREKDDVMSVCVASIFPKSILRPLEKIKPL